MCKFRLLLLVLVLMQLALTAQNNNYISFNQKTETVDGKAKTESIVDVYFDKEKNTIVKHVTNPIEIISVSNAFGELSIYYPQTNQLSFQQIEASSSKLNMIYYFANNLTDHLGLADEGFELISRNYEENYLVTTWKSPPAFKKIDFVKMVFDYGIPIYAEYIDKEGEVLKRIYYTKYQDLYSFRMPSKIIEISYKSSDDSIVSRTFFSNIETSSKPTNNLFNFKAPNDALPLQNK